MRTALGTSSKFTTWTLTLATLSTLFLPHSVYASENANKNISFTFSHVSLSEQNSITLVASLPVEMHGAVPKKEEPTPVVETKTTSKPSQFKPPTFESVEGGKTMSVMLSSYTSSPEETHGNPFITASGAHVHIGTAAWNGVAFGTQFTIPEISGDLVYTVEDRGSMRVMGTHTIDVWRETKAEAFAIGRRRVTINLLP